MSLDRARLLRRQLARLLLAAGLTIGLAALPAAAYADSTSDSISAQDNVSVADNTKDGTSLLDLAFSIKRITGDVVDQTNAAVAYASCEECQTVAVAIQVLLVTGDPEVVSPTNLALAVNESCTACETMALAFQIVLGTDGPVRFTEEGQRRLALLRRRLHELTMGELTLAQIDAEVAAAVAELQDILATQLVPVRPAEPADDGEADDDGAASGTPTPTAPASSAAPDGSPSASETPSGEASTEPTATATS